MIISIISNKNNHHHNDKLYSSDNLDNSRQIDVMCDDDDNFIDNNGYGD